MSSDYINNREFEEIIRLYVLDIRRVSKKRGEVANPILSECVAEYFYLLSDNIIRAFNFAMVEEEDAKQEAVFICLKKVSKFDPDRGKAFNYFTTMILNHYRQLYRTARNYRELKKRFLDREILTLPDNLRKGISLYGYNPREDD